MVSQRKLIVVSNRLPVSLKRNKDRVHVKATTGGLASGLLGVKRRIPFTWVGWAGSEFAEDEQEPLRKKLLADYDYYPIFLSNQQIDKFYNGFCNRVMWPLFHYLPGQVDFSLPYWDQYREVNEIFAETIAPMCDDATRVWIHDFHLMLLPALLRKARPKLKIGFFLHIPFPSSEIYRLLPVREEILQGVLGSDLIGFQTHDNCRHFFSACLRILGLDIAPTHISFGNRQVHVDSYAIGIKVDDFLASLSDKRVIKKRRELAKRYKDCKLILGVDRTDYTKGLVQKLQAYEEFLKNYPKWRGKVVLLQIAVPSRSKVPDYQKLRTDMDQWVGRINGNFGSADYTPVQYVAQDVPFTELCALYQLADVLLVTSVRDGMNLVSLEYTACQRDRHGVLLLSEFAGSAHSLSSAIFINPWDFNKLAKMIHKALSMPAKERAKRAKHNFEYVRDFTSVAWARRFVRDLESRGGISMKSAESLKTNFIALKRDFAYANERLILLDYDGTLVPFAKRPEEAKPPSKLIKLLGKLASNDRNSVYVVSGRDQKMLETWFTKLPIGLAAEHGIFLREIGENRWQQLHELSNDWIDNVKNTLHSYTRRTPGSFIETKRSSIAWHYRQADEDFGEWQAHEMVLHLEESLANEPLVVLQGKKIVEIRPQGIHKGSVAKRILKRHRSSIVLCFGDDRTDEDMFAALPREAWTCRIGTQDTNACFYLDSPKETQDILEELALLQ